jgi:hypothetical protein
MDKFILSNRFSEWKDPDFETCHTMASLKEYAFHVRSQSEKFLAALKF